MRRAGEKRRRPSNPISGLSHKGIIDRARSLFGQATEFSANPNRTPGETR